MSISIDIYVCVYIFIFIFIYVDFPTLPSVQRMFSISYFKLKMKKNIEKIR